MMLILVAKMDRESRRVDPRLGIVEVHEHENESERVVYLLVLKKIFEVQSPTRRVEVDFLLKLRAELCETK